MSSLDDANRKHARTAVVVAGTFMLGCAAPAQAGNNWDTYKQFRDLNPGINGKALRTLYQQHYGLGTAGGGPGGITIMPIFPPSDGSGGSGAPPVPHPTSVIVNSASVSDKWHNTRSFQTNDGQLVGMGSGVDIDLASSNHNIRLGNKLFNGADSVQIKVGEGVKTFTVGSQVTAAEYLAAKQVLAGHGQQLQIDESGKAVGGAVDFASIAFKNDRLHIDDLNIPTNVTVLGDFGKNPIFQVKGDLVNAGNIYAFSTSDHARRSNFAADNITNSAGALISTDLPSINTINGFAAEPTKPVDLNLQANDKVSNFGTILSSGDLTISAGSRVENGTEGSLFAHGNVQITAPRVVNSGSITSVHGDVTLDGPFNGELNVTNRGGYINANEGAINIRNDAYVGTSNTNVTGGNLYSLEVNVNAGRGTADINVDNMTGTLNQKGLASHVVSNSAVLTLGKICLTGDPTYSNTGGSIVLDGDITVGEKLNLIASGDITNSTALTITANNGTQGFDVNIIAGAKITAGGGATNNLGPIPPVVSGVSTTVDGSAGSVSGGSVLLGFANGSVNINTRSAGKTGDGGNLLIAAYKGTGGGEIKLVGSITTGGKGTGVNGNVTMFAGGSGAGFSSAISSINTTGGTGGGGDIIFNSSQPTGGVTTYNADGSITGGALGPGAASTLSQLQVGGSLIAAGDISLQTPGALTWAPASKFSITSGTGGTVDLAADSISINNGNFFSTNTLNVAVATGNVGQGGVVALQTDAPNIIATGSLTTSEVVIVSYNKGLVLFSGGAHDVNFSSAGTFMSNPGLGPITGTNVLVGSFGAGTGLNTGTPMEVDAVNLFVTAGKKGDVFAHNSHSALTTLLNTTTMFGNKTFSLSSDKDLAMQSTAVISADNVILTTGTVFSGLNGTINGGTSVALTSAGNLTSAAVPATINTPRLVLTSTGGNIGSAAPLYTVNTGAQSVVANAPTGAVFLQGPSGVKSFEVAGGVSSGVFSYSGPGSLVVSGTVLTGAGSDANFVIQTGTLSTKAANITSGNDILLQILDNVSTKIKISLGADTTLQTAATFPNGDITLAVGTPVTQVAGTQPAKGVSPFTDGGQIFWGTAGITAKGNNSVLAVNADVTFSNAISSKNISLGGNVTIYADPPSLNGAPGFVSSSFVGPAGALRAGFGGAGKVDTNDSPLISQSIDKTFTTTLDLNSIANGALQSSSSLSALRQSTVNIITAEQATEADSLVDFDDDDSYFISRGPSASLYAGAICSDDETYGAITAGGTSNDSILSSVSHAAFAERVIAPEGKTLFVPTKDMTVETQFGDIRVNSGAVVLISRNDNGIAIYNVHDSSKNSVSIDVRGRKMSLCPGRHMLVTNVNGTDFASINHIESVQHRGVSSSAIGDLKIHTSEFSTLSAMAGVLPLRAIFESKHPQCRKIADKMLKTTAVLMYLSANQGDFAYFVKPRMTALR